MTAALAEAVEQMAVRTAHIAALSAQLERGLSAISGARVLSAARERSPRILNLAFRDVSREALLFELDHRGICISGQSACLAGAGIQSHVLAGMGLEPEVL